MNQALSKHLSQRFLNQSLHTTWKTDDNAVIFPLWNLSGKIVGTHQYRPNASKEPNNNPKLGRYFTRLFQNNAVASWGLESWNLSNTLFVCEGVFDACRLTNHNKSAIAVFSNDISNSVKNWLFIVRQFRPVVVVCDSDAVGKKLAKYGHEFIVVENFKDLGDASEEYVLQLCRQFK